MENNEIQRSVKIPPFIGRKFSSFNGILIIYMLHVSQSELQLPKMSNPQATLTYVLGFLTPVQERFMHYVNRFTMTNLHLAGVRNLPSVQVQRANLIDQRCDDMLWPPRGNGRCPNTSRDPYQIMPCEGYLQDAGAHIAAPFHNLDGHWAEPTVRPHLAAEFLLCEPCRRHNRQVNRPNEASMILNWPVRLCKMHSMRFSKVKPEQRCRCYDRVRGGWRCNTCCNLTAYYLRLRVVIWRNDLYFTHLRGKSRWKGGEAGKRKVMVDYKRARVMEACPVPGCGRAAYLGTTKGRERNMEMCLGCCAVQVA